MPKTRTPQASSRAPVLIQRQGTGLFSRVLIFVVSVLLLLALIKLFCGRNELSSTPHDECDWGALAHAAGNQGAQISLSLDRKRTNTGMHGVFATSALAADEAVLYIPEKLFILGETKFLKVAKQASHEQAVNQGPETAAIAASLLAMQRRSPHGFQELWLKCLPPLGSKDLWSSVFFTDAQHSSLAVCGAQNLTLAQRWAARALSGMKIEGVPVSLVEAQWAVHVTTSRQVYMHREGQVKETAIAPVLDFVNHDADDNSNTFLDCQEAPNPPGCYLVTKRKIAAGEELRFSYNGEDWSDLQFLASFGFASAHNPFALKRQMRPPFIPPNRDHAVVKSLAELDCPEHLIDKGMVQFHKKAAMGIVSKEIDCLRLLFFFEQGEMRSPSEMSSRSRAELDKLFYQWLWNMCMGTLQIADIAALEALDTLRGVGPPSGRLAEALDEEVMALRRCVEASELKLEDDPDSVTQGRVDRSEL